MEANTVVERMNCLQAVFKDAKMYAAAATNQEAIAVYNNTLAAPFVSVAYEAAAMALAVKDCQEGEQLNNWMPFLEQNRAHTTQIYIGLGWALAQERKAWNTYLDKLNPLWTWRVVDGYGYYDGFFRRRKVFQGIYADGLTPEGLTVYMQGLGRSLWYTAKGDAQKLLGLLEKLPKEQQPNLWRGIGIASTYVGGEDLSEKGQALWNAAESYRGALATGVAMATDSRIKAGTLDEYSQWAVRKWCQLSVEELSAVLAEKKKKSAYFDWIKELETFFYHNFQ